MESIDPMMDKQRKKLLPCAADHRLDEPAIWNFLGPGTVTIPQELDMHDTKDPHVVTKSLK
jgi:hypothetical protein